MIINLNKKNKNLKKNGNERSYTFSIVQLEDMRLLLSQSKALRNSFVLYEQIQRKTSVYLLWLLTLPNISISSMSGTCSGPFAVIQVAKRPCGYTVALHEE